MNDKNVQITRRIITPSELVCNLSEKNKTLLLHQAGGMKPAQASEFWNSQNPEDKTSAEHCSMIKGRYKKEFNLIRSDVLRQVNNQELGAMLTMARNRLAEQLLSYSGKGKQGTLTECLNALQGIAKLFGESQAELQAIQPEQTSDDGELKAYLEGLKGENEQEPMDG